MSAKWYGPFGELPLRLTQLRMCVTRIKEEFEKLQKQGGWHAIVGNSFGAQVSHEQSTLVALDISIPLPDAPYRRHKQILLYRHG